MLTCLLSCCAAALKNYGGCSCWTDSCNDVVLEELNRQKRNVGKAGYLIRIDVQMVDILVVNRIIKRLITENIECESLKISRL